MGGIHSNLEAGFPSALCVPQTAGQPLFCAGPTLGERPGMHNALDSVGPFILAAEVGRVQSWGPGDKRLQPQQSHGATGHVDPRGQDGQRRVCYRLSQGQSGEEAGGPAGGQAVRSFMARGPHLPPSSPCQPHRGPRRGSTQCGQCGRERLSIATEANASLEGGLGEQSGREMMSF